MLLRNRFLRCGGQPLSRRLLSTLGIRREDPKRVWERRTPLTPDAVRSLLSDKDIRVEVETCRRRCFTDEQYANAGAQVVSRLTGDVDLVIGVKEPPVADVTDLIERNPKPRSWMLFSHTHKGQAYNTPLLSSFLGSRQTLIDHELLVAPATDGSVKRVAAFGWYAGAVGAGEGLCLTGLALLKRGIATPLLSLPRPYTFESVEAYKASVAKAGQALRKSASGPVVVGVTGRGNVADGVKNMLDAAGAEWIKPEQLPKLKESKLYACAVPPAAYMVKSDGGSYDRADYYANPTNYRSAFSERIAPYLTTLINGLGWQAGYPRTMTVADIDQLVTVGDQKLVAIQDVSCDLGGGLEFVDRHTTIDQPSFEGPGGILISTTDILPTELPTDASTHFSSRILPYVQRVLSQARPQDEIQHSIERAMIVSDGRLREQHTWLSEQVSAWRQTSERRSKKKKVLLLGSGLVAGPAVEVFAARGDVELAIASNNIAEARALANGQEGVSTLHLDVSDQEALSAAVAASDVVVSLLPAPMHPLVARHCISYGKHLVTASYISDQMKAFNEEAEKNGVLLLGECGLDPGIDSMAAMRILDRVRKEGKRVGSFISWCGGLPEPAASNVPLGYKFSWSPKAVLTAALNDARFKLDGQTRTIAGDQLLANHFPSVKLWNGLALEGVGNRDSLPYAEKYGMGEVDGMRDLFRGTLRYQGFSKLLDAFRRLGLLSSEPLDAPVESWDAFLPKTAGRAVSSTLRPGDVQGALRDLLGDVPEEAVQALEWLSLLNPSSTLQPPPKSLVPIDLFAHLLSQKLAYGPNERDSVLLHHTFKLSPLSGLDTGKEEKVTASLLCYGTEKSSAMSVTVGKTLAFAAGRVLDGHIRVRGVRGPYEREVWEGVLGDLEGAGVHVKEEWA